MAKIVQDAEGVKVQKENLEFKIEELSVKKQKEIEAFVYGCLNIPLPQRRRPPQMKKDLSKQNVKQLEQTSNFEP